MSEEGMLFESRSVGGTFESFVGFVGDDVIPKGIAFKAAQSAVVTWAQEIYLRTGVPPSDSSSSSSGSTIQSTGIYLDANQGADRITAYAQVFERFINESAIDYFLSDSNTPDSVNLYQAGQTLLGGCLSVTSDTAVGGTLTAIDWIISLNGHFTSNSTNTYNGLVPLIDSATLDTGLALINDNQTIEDNLKIQGGNDFTAIFVNGLYATGFEGDNATIVWVGFSFRTPLQAASENFALFEARWQQMARLTSQALPTWIEDGVSTNGVKTYPFPGSATWGSMYQQNLNIFNMATGLAKDRTDSQYISPVFATPNLVNLSGKYLIIISA
jgi:hypothetical protein